MSGSNPGNLPQFPGTSDTRPASLDRSGMMRRWAVPSATVGGFTTTGTGTQQRVGVAPATFTVAGALTPADFTKLATLQVPVNRLAFAANTDILNATAIAAATWTDIHANQSFTLGSGTAWLAVEFKLGLVATAAILSQMVARAVFNSAGTPLITPYANTVISPAGGFGGLTGTVFFIPPGVLPAGTTTIKTQLWTANASTAYCRANTVPATEFYSVRVVELSA